MAAILALFYGWPGPARAEDPAVAVSIAPIHSLVAGVMKGAGSPALLVPSGQSPHTFSLRPSAVRAIQEARLVFLISPEFEQGLAQVLSGSPTEKVVNLISAPGLTRLQVRAFERADDESLAPEDEHTAHHLPGTTDFHIWLDPENARAMVAAIAPALIAAFPQHAALFEQNAQALDVRLTALSAGLESDLAPVRQAPFIVFHDAYQYFEARFGLQATASVALSPERAPSARHIHDLRQIIVSDNVRCVFAEPQFSPRILDVITEELMVEVAVLDAVGAELAPGPDLYFELLDGLGHSLAQCLSSVPLESE